jgi:RNA polymerase subunit RPABC4/transcription elongation factor Spt4
MVIIMPIVIGFVILLALTALIFDISALKTVIKDRELFPTVCLSGFALVLGIIIIGCIVAIPTGLTHCKECHKFYWDKSYCEVCGDKLRNTVNCHNCGKEFNGNENYCPYCGCSLPNKEVTDINE